MPALLVKEHVKMGVGPVKIAVGLGAKACELAGIEGIDEHRCTGGADPVVDLVVLTLVGDVEVPDVEPLRDPGVIGAVVGEDVLESNDRGRNKGIGVAVVGAVLLFTHVESREGAVFVVLRGDTTADMPTTMSISGANLVPLIVTVAVYQRKNRVPVGAS